MIFRDSRLKNSGSVVKVRAEGRLSRSRSGDVCPFIPPSPLFNAPFVSRTYPYVLIIATVVISHFSSALYACQGIHLDGLFVLRKAVLLIQREYGIPWVLECALSVLVSRFNTDNRGGDSVSYICTVP